MCVLDVCQRKAGKGQLSGADYSERVRKRELKSSNTAIRKETKDAKAGNYEAWIQRFPSQTLTN